MTCSSAFQTTTDLPGHMVKLHLDNKALATFSSWQLWVNQNTNLEKINTFLVEKISGFIFTILTKTLKYINIFSLPDTTHLLEGMRNYYDVSPRFILASICVTSINGFVDIFLLISLCDHYFWKITLINFILWWNLQGTTLY